MGKLKNKVALITGSTRSIGLEIAKLFTAKGATVIMTGRTSKEKGKEIAQSEGINDYLNLDVCSESDWKDIAQYIESNYKRLDILVNNAGIDGPVNANRPQDPEHCTLEDWRAVHAVNLDGTFLGCKMMMPLLKRSEHASIINMGSRSGLVGIPSNAAYSSSKAAILNFTRTVAIYCAENGYPIRCNTILPAAILTDLWDSEFGHDESRMQRIQNYTRTIPLKRMGQASEVAKLAVFLASNDSLFITGAYYTIDGGIMAGTGSYNSNQINTDSTPLINSLTTQKKAVKHQLKETTSEQRFFERSTHRDKQLKEESQFHISLK
ncbi:SDR family NAD(P)-dependent oxidoreductase [Legionella sp. CNM-1927-20]|uniref:SDR family NAD(P)-dependent oxidoreductase n=1 Tax=Legionella sp. CNM-1927-20 TaxID=3422221 RepID=UPI00403B07E8